jgi:hypothetical protein
LETPEPVWPDTMEMAEAGCWEYREESVARREGRDWGA